MPRPWSLHTAGYEPLSEAKCTFTISGYLKPAVSLASAYGLFPKKEAFAPNRWDKRR
jgi:hypothetical protein